MHVQVLVSLEQGEQATHTVDELPAAVLEALGGDMSKDTCSVQVSTTWTPPVAETEPVEG